MWKLAWYTRTGTIQRTVPFRHCPDYLKCKIPEVFLLISGIFQVIYTCIYWHFLSWTGEIYLRTTHCMSIFFISADWYWNYYYPYIKSASGCWSSSQQAVVNNHVVHLLPFSVFSDPIHPGITPILPKTANQPSTRATTGLIRDPCCKTYLYVFGFTRNNAW